MAVNSMDVFLSFGIVPFRRFLQDKSVYPFQGGQIGRCFAFWATTNSNKKINNQIYK
jgi:hypothetical protein